MSVSERRLIPQFFATGSRGKEKVRGRLMVGRQTLDLAVQVRVLAPQPSRGGKTA